MKKLLNKTAYYNAIFSALLILCSAPVFYLMIEKLYIQDVDDALVLRKKEFMLKFQPTLLEREIIPWNHYNRDILIAPDTLPLSGMIIQSTFLLDTLDKEWEPYRVLYSPVTIEKNRHLLMVRLSLVESQDLMEAIAILYIVILLVLIAGFFFINKNVSKRIWNPFYKTLHAIEQFNIEHIEAPVLSKTTIQEFNDLNISIQKLISNNIQTYKGQKEFIENAAHELQTPVALFQSKLDLLLQNPSLTREQAQIIQSLYETASKLSRLNKNLLLLTKIENSVFEKNESINLWECINDAWFSFKEQAEAKNIQLDIYGESEVMITANRGLVESLLNNLVSNSIRHNPVKGQAVLNLSRNQLILQNTAMNGSLDEQKLFKRFSKSTDQLNGNGLGLAIVASICHKYNWKLSYQYEQSQHYFIITFEI